MEGCPAGREIGKGDEREIEKGDGWEIEKGAVVTETLVRETE